MFKCLDWNLNVWIKIWIEMSLLKCLDVSIDLSRMYVRNLDWNLILVICIFKHFHWRVKCQNIKVPGLREERLKCLDWNVRIETRTWTERGEVAEVEDLEVGAGLGDAGHQVGGSLASTIAGDVQPGNGSKIKLGYVRVRLGGMVRLGLVR